MDTFICWYTFLCLCQVKKADKRFQRHISGWTLSVQHCRYEVYTTYTVHYRYLSVIFFSLYHFDKTIDGSPDITRFVMYVGISKINQCSDCVCCYYDVLNVPGLTDVAVGLSDLEPRDQQEMTPSDLNARRCGQVTTPVGGGKTLTLTCAPVGVTGRYLIAQTLGWSDSLSFCEVEAGRVIVLLFFLSPCFCRPCFHRPYCNWD